MKKETILTDEEIIAIGHQVRAIESGVDGYILPVTFARAIEQAILQSEQLQATEAYPCRIVEADFETNTVTLEMQGKYTVSSGQKYLCDVPLYRCPVPNSQVNLDSSNHIVDARKMVTPLAKRKIQSKIDEGEYRYLKGATVLVNEHGRAAIVNHGGAFYWVENSALAWEYHGRPIPVNSCMPKRQAKKEQAND